MMVLVACEESQRVCEAFRMRGYEAYSADIQEPSGGHPEWHILGDVLPIINGSCEFDTMDGAHHHIDKPWDLLIAHPPCTYLTTAGAVRLYHNHKVIDPEREKKGFEAADFFYKFLQVSLLGTKVCVENPLPLKHFLLPRYSRLFIRTTSENLSVSGHASGWWDCPFSFRPTFWKNTIHGLTREDITGTRDGTKRFVPKPFGESPRRWLSNGNRKHQ